MNIRRWEKATVDLIACQQKVEDYRFLNRCAAIAHNEEERDAKVKSQNSFGLNPFWCYDPSRFNWKSPLSCEPRLQNGTGRLWAPDFPCHKQRLSPQLVTPERAITPPANPEDIPDFLKVSDADSGVYGTCYCCKRDFFAN